MVPSNATILLLLFRCYCHNMFRSYDHHQAADSGVLSQAVCLTAVAVSWISNHNSWLLIQLTLIMLLPTIDLICIVNNMMLLSRVFVNCEMFLHTCCLQNGNILERHVNINSGFCEQKLCSGQGDTFLWLFIYNHNFVSIMFLLNVIQYHNVCIVANTEECFNETISVMGIDLEFLWWRKWRCCLLGSGTV
jgi:hypothetical protein